MASPELIVVVSAVRTPIGRFMGGLSTLAAPDLGRAAVAGALEVAKVPADAIDVLYFGDSAINIELPIKMVFEVIEAPPAVKGNTADGGSKQVVIETGISVNVPLFIKTGDKIKVNTQTGEYSERAN